MNPPGPVLVLDRPGIGARLTPESVLDLARCTQVPEALWPRHLVRRIIAELRRPQEATGSTARAPLEDLSAVEREADLLWGTLTAGRMAEHAGVRFLLAEDGRLLLENASRAHGSPDAATPSCITCGGLTEDVLCETCVDLHRPAASPKERAHRERIRAFLAHGAGSSTGPTWSFLRNVVATLLPDVAPLLSRATPLRLHRSGYFEPAPVLWTHLISRLHGR